MVEPIVFSSIGVSHDQRILRLCGLTLAAASLLAVPASAQDSRTVALAASSPGMLERAKLDSIATRQAGSDDVFVAALFFPGQLLVVSSKYAVSGAAQRADRPADKYRDAYIDLNVAVDPATKVFIEDMGADGIRPTLARRPSTSTPRATRGFRSTATGRSGS